MAERRLTKITRVLVIAIVLATVSVLGQDDQALGWSRRIRTCQPFALFCEMLSPTPAPPFMSRPGLAGSRGVPSPG